MYAPNIEKLQEPKGRRAGDISADSSLGRLLQQDLQAAAAGNRTEVIGNMARFLDRVVPLHDASHQDVDTYGVDIPLRYASLFAILKDGRKVRLRDARDFAGWSGWSGKRSFLVRNGRRHIEIRVNPANPVGMLSPGYVCDLVFETSHDTTRKFIAPDGSQLVLCG